VERQAVIAGQTGHSTLAVLGACPLHTPGTVETPANVFRIGAGTFGASSRLASAGNVHVVEPHNDASLIPDTSGECQLQRLLRQLLRVHVKSELKDLVGVGVVVSVVAPKEEQIVDDVKVCAIVENGIPWWEKRDIERHGSGVVTEIALQDSTCAGLIRVVIVLKQIKPARRGIVGTAWDIISVELVIEQESSRL